jgi:hypothetical protein
MNDSLFSRKDIIKAEIIDMVIETNSDFIKSNKKFINSCITKVKNNREIFMGIIFLNKNSYYGRYSFSYNSLISKTIEKKDQSRFLETFLHPYPAEIYKNNHLDKNFKENFNKHLHYELLAFNYLFEKRYYDSEFPVNILSLQKCKNAIFNIYDIDKNSRFLSNKDTILIKKGKEQKIYNINEIIIKFFKNGHFDEKIDNYIRSNYKKEYSIIFYYLNNIQK